MTEILRTLAIDPTTKGFAFAVLDGSHELLEWGTAEGRGRSEPALLARITRLCDRYEPELLVIEDTSDSRRGARARRFLKMLTTLGARQGIPVRTVTRARVREILARQTKQEIAEAVAVRFPELVPKLPRTRKPWTSEDERMSVFDAASFALAVLLPLEGGFPGQV